jgi:hypothetical protein
MTKSLKKVVTILTEKQRSLVVTALQTAEEVFRNNKLVCMSMSTDFTRLADQFDRQAYDTRELIQLIVVADEIAVTDNGI